jgi:hypothetical protein
MSPSKDRSCRSSRSSPKHSGKEKTPSKVGETMDKFRQQLQATLESSQDSSVEVQSSLVTTQSSQQSSYAQSSCGLKILTSHKKGLVSLPDANWQEESPHGDGDSGSFSDDDSLSSTSRSDDPLSLSLTVSKFFSSKPSFFQTQRLTNAATAKVSLFYLRLNLC